MVAKGESNDHLHRDRATEGARVHGNERDPEPRREGGRPPLRSPPVPLRAGVGEDVVVDQEVFEVFVDPQSAEFLEGTTVDFVSDVTGTGFMFNNPQAEISWDDPLAQRVQKVIDERIAPSLAGHGGWVELMAVDGDTATIQFGGGCQGCGMSQVTLKEGIEAAILQEVPEIKKVLDDTDHSSGANPYYSR
jgi:Fe/S biogenesis protein NfuA